MNQNDWQGLEPAWGAANEVILNDSSTVVLVPIADSVIMINPFLDAYVVFFEDSLSEIQMHVLFFQADTTQYLTNSFPSISNFSGLIWEFYDEEDTYGVTVVEDGVISGCGCSSVFGTYIDTVTIASILPRTKAPKCPRWKNNIWEWIAGAAGDVWKVVKGFFNGIQGNGGSGSISGNGNSNGTGGTGGSGGTGGTGGTGGSGSGGGTGLGGFGGFGFGGNGGGGGNNVILNLSSVFTEWQLKQMLQAAIWMNDTYGTNWDVNDLYASMDLNCIWEVSDFIQNPGGGPVIGDEDEGPTCALAFYIGTELNLNLDEIECISGNYNVLTELRDIIDHGDVIDVCDPYRGKAEILRDGIIGACASNSIQSISDIYNAFGSDDKIVIYTNLVDLCPVYACILDQMISGPAGTTFICELLSAFEGNGQHVLQFRPINFAAQGLNSQAYAATIYNEGKVQILINTGNCTSISPLVAFETLQHELLHADIKRRLLEDYNSENGQMDFESAFFELIYFEYGPNASFSEHEFMLDFYLDQMVESLIEYNNGIGAPEDFIGLVYFGFPQSILFYNNITLSQALDMYDDYQNFIALPGNLNSSLSNCD